MNDITKQSAQSIKTTRPKYERPQITIMTDEEVLKAFQMTALEISAAGCWWSASSWSA